MRFLIGLEDVFALDQPIRHQNDSNTIDLMFDENSEIRDTYYSQSVFQQILNQDSEFHDDGNSSAINLEKDEKSQPETFGSVSPPENESLFGEFPQRKDKKAPLNLNNRRRKLIDREKLRKLFIQDQNPEKKTPRNGKSNRTGDQWTKNILKVVKCSFCNFLRESQQGQNLLALHPWLQKAIRNKTFYLDDFDKLYKTECLQMILDEYFERKILYRDFMISRVTEKNKKLYMYFLDIFEENFKNREFNGIAETKLNIEKRQRLANSKDHN